MYLGLFAIILTVFSWAPGPQASGWNGEETGREKTEERKKSLKKGYVKASTQQQVQSDNSYLQL